jgi:ABC-type antimicrobial peptide transport system permease subunit
VRHVSWRASFAHLWMATDLRGAIRGQEWLATVATGCLTFTTALSSVLYAGADALSASLRAELASDYGDVVMLRPRGEQQPCPLGVRRCPADFERERHAIDALQRALTLAPRHHRPASLLRGMTALRISGRSRQVELVGTDAALFQLQPLTVVSGRVWTPSEERAEPLVAVVGRTLYDSLAEGRATPMSLRVGRLALEVIGVIEAGAAAAVPVNDAVLIPRGVFARVYPVSMASPLLIGRERTADGSSTLIDALYQLGRRYPALAGRLTVTTTADQLGEVAQMERALGRGIAGLSVVLVLAAVVAVSALMVTVARAHRRAVGIARAMGATRGVIAAQGALIGTVLGGAGVLSGALLTAAGAYLLPALLDVSPLAFTSLLSATAFGGAPSLVAAVTVATVMFVRLAMERPALLLA